jgi:HK97 family phage prohead protease
MTQKKGARQNRQSAKEIRVSKTRRLEVRKNADGTRSLDGYFATYGTISHSLGSFKERLAKGCFDLSLRQQPMTALVNHDDNKLLGKTGQNLTVVSDDTGLRFRVNPLPDTTYSQDLVALADQGLVDSCSFGFYAVDEQWSTMSDGTPLRTITEAIVFEGSVLAGPEAAYPSTSVSLRAQRRAKAKRDDIDDGDTDFDDPTNDLDCEGEDENDPACQDEDRDLCACNCRACAEGRCERCSDIRCADLRCMRDGCFIQSDEDRRKHNHDVAVLQLRLKLQHHRRPVSN